MSVFCRFCKEPARIHSLFEEARCVMGKAQWVDRELTDVLFSQVMRDTKGPLDRAVGVSVVFKTITNCSEIGLY
jgi:hypothetical protein